MKFINNFYEIDPVEVEIVRYLGDNTILDAATDGWIIKGTGNRNTPVDDTVVGTDKDDLITPGWGNDTASTGGGNDLVQGGWSDNTLLEEGGNNLKVDIVMTR